MSVATMAKKAAKAIGFPMDSDDPYREARQKLPTLDNLASAEEAQKQASRDLEAALLLAKSGDKPAAYVNRFQAAFDVAANHVRTIREGLNKRRALAPPRLREDCYRAKQTLVKATTRRDKLAETIAEQKREVAKRTEAVKLHEGRESLVLPNDTISLDQVKRERERVQYELISAQRELEHLEESFNEALQEVFTCESTYNTLSGELLNG